MTKEKFKEMMENNDNIGVWKGDNAFQGLQILSKYTKNLIRGAEHDIIYSENVEILLKAGITEEDVKELNKLNWIIEDDYLACFI